MVGEPKRLLDALENLRSTGMYEPVGYIVTEAKVMPA